MYPIALLGICFLATLLMVRNSKAAILIIPLVLIHRRIVFIDSNWMADWYPDLVFFSLVSVWIVSLKYERIRQVRGFKQQVFRALLVLFIGIGVWSVLKGEGWLGTISVGRSILYIPLVYFMSSSIISRFDQDDIVMMIRSILWFSIASGILFIGDVSGILTLYPGAEHSVSESGVMRKFETFPPLVFLSFCVAVGMWARVEIAEDVSADRRPVTALVYVAMAVGILSVYFIFTRTVLVLTVLVLLTGAFVRFRSHKGGKRTTLATRGVAFLVPAMALVGFLLLGEQQLDFWQERSEAETGEGRLILTIRSIEQISDSPYFGEGYSRSALSEMTEFYGPWAGDVMWPFHLVFTGWVGTLMLGFSLLFFVFESFRNTRGAPMSPLRFGLALYFAATFVLTFASEGFRGRYLEPIFFLGLFANIDEIQWQWILVPSSRSSNASLLSPEPEHE